MPFAKGAKATPTYFRALPGALGEITAMTFTVTAEITGLSASRPKLPATIGSFRMSHVAFHNNSTAVPKSPVERLMIRDVSVSHCHHWACSASGVVFDNVRVAEVQGGGSGGKAPSFFWGCAVSNVRLQGKLSGFMWKWMVDPGNDDLSRRFLWANQQFYKSVDWALDISEARFSTYGSLLSIPSQLIRRNSAQQFIMTREAATRLMGEPGGSTVWKVTAQELIKTELSDTVIVVGGSGKRQRAQLDEAQGLIDQGFLT